MNEILSNLDERLLQFKNTLANVSDLTAIEAEFRKQKVELDTYKKSFLTLSSEEKRIQGPLFQQWEKALREIKEARENDLKAQLMEQEEAKEGIDVTMPANIHLKTIPYHNQLGSLHPITQVQNELIDIFQSLGFAVVRGPEAELEYYNFDALNIPATHPARDMQDTFFLQGQGKVMRTHTSSVQVRAMQTYGAPLRVIVPGRVFRNEALDASHEHTFYQLEGMMIDQNLTIGDLLGAMKLLLKEMFGREIKVRLRPGYFPFVEPGFELDAECAICSGSGCSVCKHSGWVELIPCGMIHPKVLEHGKIDSTKYNGWAFGMGLSRLVMMKYKIDDIRLMQSADLRFLSQFSL